MTGFVYIWRDRKHKRYYIGAHWGAQDDGYVCSSNWMKQAYQRRPTDFKRRVLKADISSREEMFNEESRWLKYIKPEERKVRYYNLNLNNQTQWYTKEHNLLTVAQRISKAKTGKKRKPFSEETKKKMSLAKQGKSSVIKRTRRACSEATKLKISLAKKGKLLSEEHRQNLCKPKSDASKMGRYNRKTKYSTGEL